MQKSMETLRNQTSQNIGAKLTLLPEDSHVSLIQSPENDLAQMTSATCGQKCLEQFGKFSRVGLWAKTLAELLIGMEEWYSSRCILTWKMKGTKYKRLLFQLAPSMRRTEGTECGLSLIKTPCAMDGQVTSGKKNPVSGNSGTLAQEIMSEYAPTMMKIGILPTPTARDYKGGNSLNHLTRVEINLKGKIKDNHLNQLPNYVKIMTGKTSQLNPLFVEEMMGYPPNWTALPFQNGELKQ